MGFRNEYSDPETGSPIDTDKGYHEKNGIYVDEAGAVPGESFAYGKSTYAKIQRFAGRFGVEQRGIERVPENERTDTSLRKVGTMVRTVFWR